MAMRGRIETADGAVHRRCGAWVIALLAAVSIAASACGTEVGHSGKRGAAAGGAPASRTASSVTKGSPQVRATPAPTAPVISHRVIVRRDQIPFSTRTRDSAALPKGVTRIQQPGRPGVRVKTYRLTLKDGAVSGRRLIRKRVARPPVPRIELHGTHVAAPQPKPKPHRSCDPNYAGGCVPVASDVDCGGGSGDGPAYFNGTARVVGEDVYDLDADDDGYACED